MGARMVPANRQTKTKKIFYMSFWLERLSILLQIYTFACNFCSRKGGRASIGYRASIGTYTVTLMRFKEVLGFGSYHLGSIHTGGQHRAANVCLIHSQCPALMLQDCIISTVV